MKQINRLIRRSSLIRWFCHYANPLATLFLISSVVSFFLLPTHPFRRSIYISENALLPAQVHTHYAHHDSQFIHNIYPTAKDLPFNKTMHWIFDHLMDMGYRPHVVGYPCVSHIYNVSTCFITYTILRAPRADGSEALVLSSSWMNEQTGIDGIYGSLLTLSMARFWSKYYYWAKDLIFVFANEIAGVEYWAQLYHSIDDSATIHHPTIDHAGDIQAAMHLDFANSQVQALAIRYTGLWGQVPNMDIISTVHRVAQANHVQITFHDNDLAFGNDSDYLLSLRRLVHAICDQAQQTPLGPHGLFKYFGVDAITVSGVVSTNSHAIVSLNTVATILESSFRSLNNLLERFHHSQSFYLYSSTHHFTSILLFIPSIGLINAAFLVSAIRLWMLAANDDLTAIKLDRTRHQRAIISPLANVVLAFTISFIAYISHELSRHLTQFIITLGILFAYYIPTPTSPQFAHLLASSGLILSAAVILTLSVINFGLGALTSLLFIPSWLVFQFGDPAVNNPYRWIILIVFHPNVIGYVLMTASTYLNQPFFHAAALIIDKILLAMGPAVIWILHGAMTIIWSRLMACGRT